MGTIANLVIKINGDIAGLRSALTGAADAVQQTGEKMQGVGLKMTAGVTLPIAGLGAASIKAAADQEQLQIAFTTMLGSAEKATAMVENLNKFAAETPFQSSEVQSAARMLIGYGVAAEDVTGTMRQLGDISAGLNIPLGDMAYLFGTARVQGRLFAADINQFSGRGVPIIKALAATMGVAEGAIKGMVEEGKVGFPELQAALNYLTEDGSQFGGLMEAQSQSINGMISTLKDNVELSMAAIGKTIIEQFDLKTKLASALEWTTQMKDALLNLAATNPQLFQLGVIIAGVAAMAGPALLALGTAVSFAGTAIGGLGAVIGFLLSPIGLLVAAVAVLGAAWAFNWGGIQEATASALSALQPLFGSLVATVSAAVDQAAAAWARLSTAFATGQTSAGAIVGELVAQFTGLGTDLYDTTDNIYEFVEALTGSSGAASAAADGVWNAGQKFREFGGAVAEAWNQVAAAGSSIAAQVGAILAPALGRVQTAFSGIGVSVGQLAPSFSGLVTAVQGMATAVQPIIEGLAQALGVTLVVAASVGANLFAAAIQNMAGLVGPVIDQVTATINLLATTVQGVAALVMAVATGDWAGAWAAMRTIASGFVTYFQSTFTNVSAFIKTVFNTIKTAVLATLSDLDAGAKSQMDALKGWWDSAWNSLTGAFEPVKSGIDTVVSAVDNLKKGIESFKDWIGGISIPNPFAGITMPAIPSWLGGAQNNQLGTAYAHGGWSWVGENRRPELLYLPRGAQVVPWQQAKETQGGGVTVNIQSASIRSEQELWELAYALDEIRRRRR